MILLVVQCLLGTLLGSDTNKGTFCIPCQDFGKEVWRGSRTRPSSALHAIKKRNSFQPVHNREALENIKEKQIYAFLESYSGSIQRVT